VTDGLGKSIAIGNGIAAGIRTSIGIGNSDGDSICVGSGVGERLGVGIGNGDGVGHRDGVRVGWSKGSGRSEGSSDSYGDRIGTKSTDVIGVGVSNINSRIVNNVKGINRDEGKGRCKASLTILIDCGLASSRGRIVGKDSEISSIGHEENILGSLVIYSVWFIQTGSGGSSGTCSKRSLSENCNG